MAVETVNDRIDVLAKFVGGELTPLVVRWRSRRYHVRRVNLRHHAPAGSDSRHYFSVTTDAGEMTLAYSQRDLVWRLRDVSLPG